MQASGILIFLVDVDSNLVRHDCMLSNQRLSNKVIIGDLEEGANGCWVVVLPCSPRTHLRESRQNGRGRLEEEAITALGSPRRQGVCARRDLVAASLDAVDIAASVLGDQPVPESGAEIEAVVEVLGLDEHVCVQQVGHQTATPTLRPSSWKVESLEKPSIRSASRWSV